MIDTIGLLGDRMMSYCPNPHCQNPHNPDGAEVCHSCGSNLLLKGRYRVVKPLSQGSRGRTFLAIDEDRPSRPNCAIAQLCISTDDTASALVESPGPAPLARPSRQTIARLDEVGEHPQLPEFLATFDSDGYQYWVQEYIDGPNLAEILNVQGNFNEAQIWKVLGDVLPALQALHDRQLIHRDIKPENIICRRRDGKLILVDYASAKFAVGTTPVKNGTVSGSAEYAAPEQTRGEAIPSSDLYSLGLTCLHLLTQISPFDLYDIKAERWVWRDYLKVPVSRHLGYILDKLVARSPKQRYQSADRVLKDLKSGLLPAYLTTRPNRWTFAAAGVTAIASIFALTNARLHSPVTHTTTSVAPATQTVEQLPSHQRVHSMSPEMPPMRTLALGAGSVWSIAIDPNSQTLISGGADGTIQVRSLDEFCHNARGCPPTQLLSGHNGPVWSVAVSPDGRTIASASEDKTIKLWHLRSGKLQREIRGHFGEVFDVAFSPDGRTIASVSEDNTVKLWDRRSGKLQRTLRGHVDEVQSVAFSPNGKRLISGGMDGTVRVWDWRTGNHVSTLIGHADTVWSVAVSPDGQTLASASEDDTIKLWDLDTGTLLHTFTGHSKPVQSVAFSPDGRTLASSDLSGTIKLWQMDTGGMLGTLKGHSAWVELAFSADGRTLASGSFDDTIKIWNLSSRDRL